MSPPERAAESDERQKLITRLLARLAHEIRNPLSSLDIHVQLLAEDLAALPAGERTRLSGRLDVIRGELQRLDGVLQQYLKLAGPLPPAVQPTALDGTVRHVCELLQPEAAARRIALTAELPVPAPIVAADPGQLTQALLNLVLNGLQAVERDGSVAVKVRSGEPPGTVEIEVSDTGPGVATDRRAAIFEPFVTTRAEGSGLGLWIVQQIAAAHGGAIAVADAPGGGAVFSLRLPLAAAPHA